MPTSTFSRRNAAPLFLTLSLLPVGLAPAAARAQTVCDLTAAKADFETGLFDHVIAMLEPCIEKGFAPAEQEDAWALLAKTWLALDAMDKADAAISRLLAQNPGFRPAFDDPLAFQRRVGQLRDQRPAAVMVTSVSKTPESLRLAPATVAVVTAEEIARRGYLDLEQVLHDLPGFDFSLGNGDLYSTFYQRGYRSRNDRTLFLVDGIEENDLWSNAVHLSRQYPLTNVERIEVIYGPASTLYGPNAFAGVINVITRAPGEMIAEKRRTAALVTAGGGQWNTRWGDLTLAGSRGDQNVSFSLSARLYQSDEWDLSGYPNWDYNPSFFDPLDYARIVNATVKTKWSEDESKTLGASPWVQTTATGGFELSPAGAERARALDKAAFNKLVEGSRPHYSDLTNDWLLGARLQLSNLTLGFQTWRREEGFNSWYTDNLYAGADNGTLWVPQQSLFFLKYGRELSPRLLLNLTTSYKRHTLAGNTHEQQLVSYANGSLSLLDLAQGNEPFWRETGYALLSEQFKGETTLVYNPSQRLSVVGGFDARNSLVQGNYLLTIENSPPAGNPQFFDELDAGAFIQASFRPRETWKVVAGSRFDYNDQRQGSGYGTVSSPRLGVIYSPSSWVFKAIYAEAFKAPSNFNRYATAPGLREEPNPGLAPERVRNLELSAGWQPRPELSLEASAYRARYSDIVTTKEITRPNQTTTLQNQNLGALEITGLQALGKWRIRGWDVDANYTWTDPRTDPLAQNGQPLRDLQGRRIADVRIGDIAEHRANLGLTGKVGGRWTLNLRANAAGERRAGQNLELLQKPPEQWIDRYGRPVDPNGVRVDSSVVVNAAVAYENVVPGVRLQLLINNLLDARYDDPGIGPADDVSFARLLPQPGRAVFLRLSLRR